MKDIINSKKYLPQIAALVFIVIMLSSGLSTSLPSLSKEASATTTLFQDKYQNSGWSQVGTQITVNSLFFPGIVKFNHVTGGGTVQEERVLKKLPAPLPSGNWTADFDYKFTSSSIPTAVIFDLSKGTADPESQPVADQVDIEHGFGVNQLFVEGPLGTQSSPIPIFVNTQYYVRLDKTPTLLTLSVFSDPARTINVPGSPVTLAISPSDYNNNLNYIQHSGCRDCGTARTLTAKIDNTRIFVKETSQTLFLNNNQQAVWSQVGSEITANGVGFPGIVKFKNEHGGGGIEDTRVLKHLAAPLPVNWTANFDYKFTASSLVRSWIFVLSSTSDDPATQDATHIIMVEHGFEANQLMIDRSWTGPNSTSSAGIPISPNKQYYVTLEKTPTYLILSVFSDKDRTNQIAGSPVSLAISPSDYNGNLNYIQHDGCTPCGPARTLTAQIDNTIISSP